MSKDRLLWGQSCTTLYEGNTSQSGLSRSGRKSTKLLTFSKIDPTLVEQYNNIITDEYILYYKSAKESSFKLLDEFKNKIIC